MLEIAAEAARRTLDALAHDVLRALDGLEFRIAASRDETEATYRLRYETVIAYDWATPDDHPDGLERDEDDAHSVCVVCLDGDRVVGSLRLVKPSPGSLLPTERDFDLRLEPSGAVVDIGRVVVAPSHRGPLGHLVLLGLMARGWLEARALGCQRLVGVASPKAMSLYEGLGMKIAVLGPSRRHWGEERRPIEIQGASEHAIASFDLDPAAALTEERPEAESPSRGDGLSRRDLLVRAGSLTAGALVVVGVPETAAAARPAGVGAGPTDRRTVELVCQIDQVGAAVTGYGYLTHLKGIPDAELFTRPLPTSGAEPSTMDIETARFVIVVQASIATITALGTAITGHGTGTADFRLLPNGGARLDDPGSFGGISIATFAVEFQHNLAIDAPDRALASFTADLTQRSARAFTLQSRRYQLGKAKLPWSLRATGRGVRTDAATPISQHFVSGDLGVVDAVTRR